MKKYISIAIPLFVVISTYSQSKSKSISFSIAPSIPVGAFARTNINSNTSGFAKIGQAINIEYLAMKGKEWGIAVRLNAQRNPINTKEFENEFNEVFFSNPINPSSGFVFDKWKFDKASWFAGSLTAGAFGQFPFKENSNVTFIPKFMLGLVYASSPAVTGKSSTDTSLATVKQSDATGLGVAYTFSAGIQYSMKKKSFLILSIDYCGTNNVKFKDVNSTLYAQSGTGGNMQAFETSSTTDGKQNMGALNIYLGIGFRL